jgi:hypothetical protein
VGINGTHYRQNKQWDPPSGWKVPQQLRVLILGLSTSNEALSSLSFPPGNRLQLLYIHCYTPYTPYEEPPRSLPASLFFNLDSLKVLHLCLSSLEGLPNELVSHARGLRAIILELCSQLKELPSDLGKLTHLKAIVLNGCESLRTLPDSIMQLPELQILDIRGPAGLVDTFDYEQNGWQEMPHITKWLNSKMTLTLTTDYNGLDGIKFAASRPSHTV